jgi:hypothetical protein
MQFSPRSFFLPFRSEYLPQHCSQKPSVVTLNIFVNTIWQKPFSRECLVSWSIIMVENPAVRPKSRPFSKHSYTLPLHHVHIISSVHCFSLWNEFKLNRILGIEESDEHCLHLRFLHARFLVSRACRLKLRPLVSESH